MTKYDTCRSMEGDESDLMLSPGDNQGEEPQPQSLRPMKWVAVLAVAVLALVGLVGFAVGRSTAPSFTNDEAENVAGTVQEWLKDKNAKMEKGKMLKLLNQIRCMHAVPAFKWSDALASDALAWANTGQKSHSTSKGAFKKYGENMCWGQTIEECVNFWYDEIEKTKDGALSAANYGASHYSQLVWKQTTEVGCGMAKTIIVCQFKKPGNWAGACPDCYKDNVFAPKKSKSACA